MGIILGRFCFRKMLTMKSSRNILTCSLQKEDIIEKFSLKDLLEVSQESMQLREFKSDKRRFESIYLTKKPSE